MIKLNNLSKWIIVAFASFGAGILFHYAFQSSKPIKIVETTVSQGQKPRGEAANDLNDDARKKYQELMAEYVDYTSNENNKYVSFKEFISIRKDELVQNKKYTEQDIQTDEEIKRWLSSYTRPKSNAENVETSRYSINGSVTSPYKSKNNCFISIGVYTLPLNGETPPTPMNSISPQAPLANAFIGDCRGGNFNLDFILSNFEGQETTPIYIAAYAFDGASNLYSFPLAYGTDKNISGIPPSLLAKRKHNAPVKILLKEIDRKKLGNININIKSQKGLWAYPYGLDGLAKLAPDLGLYRTSISGHDDVARLRDLPFGSNIYVQLFDPNKDNRTNILIPSSSEKTDIELPQDIFKIRPHHSNPTLVIIPPNNISEGEIIVSAIRSLKNKMSFSFDDPQTQSFTMDDLDPEDSIIELKHKNKSLGIMGIRLKKNETTILNPVPKKIENIAGNIHFVKRPNAEVLPCKDYSIEIKYTDKSVNTGWNGKFSIYDIDIIDDKIELLIEGKEQKFLVPLVVHNNIKKLDLDLELPDQRLIALWNRSEPTLPINGMVYGNYTYHKSYKAFLRGLDNNVAVEAMYFDDNTGRPSRSKYSTSLSRFLFSDIPSGAYVIYLVAGVEIIHTRVINVAAGATTIIY